MPARRQLPSWHSCAPTTRTMCSFITASRRRERAAMMAYVPRLTLEEWQTIYLTLRVAGLAVGFGLPLALLIGWLLALRFPGRFLLNALVYLPLALPPVVTGWLLLMLCG